MKGRSTRHVFAQVIFLILAMSGVMVGILVAFFLMFFAYGGIELVLSVWHDKVGGYYWQGLVALFLGIAAGFTGAERLWVVLMRRTRFLSESEIESVWNSMNERKE